MNEKIYKDVFEKYGKWIERLANGWLFKANINMDGADLVSETIMATIPFVLDKTKNPEDADWKKSLYTTALNKFKDILKNYNAQKRIPRHLTKSLDDDSKSDTNRDYIESNVENVDSGANLPPIPVETCH
jgi:DNA-directed RNA polymerase specialized sigma24 family protein